MTLEQLAKQGRRTASMTTAATITSKTSQIRKESIKQAFCDFDSIKHRYEYIDTIEGVNYYDDAGACSNEAAWFSFDNLRQDVVWITYSENPDADDLKPQVRKYVKAIVCIGKNAEKFHYMFDDIVGGKIYKCSNIADAAKISKSLAKDGDNVMFTPATKVKDNFSSYAERGDYFKQCVQSLGGLTELPLK